MTTGGISRKASCVLTILPNDAAFRQRKGGKHEPYLYHEGSWWTARGVRG